ncbi:uncharacterized protein J4E88_000223 [Alternaria novae-zelandiae]|uniref:uncharacterized protein n=1 Tax=Alternaria novae-zelandiae TaxID=430562 RepID=UPI0020C27047|nr:uncharacterized protein J4E88_000223 [Alternaria novae-zelandiae]KAI4696051.1 hypothetical protein J4E88_000223 [Alternaria novae-zelandiae]
MAERRLVFNVPELKKVAAKALNRPASDVYAIEKIAEGGFNRILEVTMDDGSSVLARLPYASTLPRRLAVASEVATLDFLRTKGIPVPRVLDYSTGENSVGVEYMLIERLPGKPLSDIWFSLAEEERCHILHKIVLMETKLFAFKLPASGSIYYPRDLSANTPRIGIPGSNGGLCVGPYASMRWWYGERGNLDIDQGPHANPELVLRSHAKKELAWIRKYGRPRHPFYREYAESFGYKKQDPQDHVHSLGDYIRLVPHLVPNDATLHSPTLRHPDLSPNNILISDDLQITGFIDWQHSEVLPAFLAADIPAAFANYADEESRSFTEPKLPETLSSMAENERAEAEELYRRRHIHFWYLGLTQVLNGPHWQACTHDGTFMTRQIFRDVGAPWEGDNAHLQIGIADVVEEWPVFASVALDGTVPPCPVVISKQEMQRRADMRKSLHEGNIFREELCDKLGVSHSGYTSHEGFDFAKEKATMAKECVVNKLKEDPEELERTLLTWPFDDYDENE